MKNTNVGSLFGYPLAIESQYDRLNDLQPSTTFYNSKIPRFFFYSYKHKSALDMEKFTIISFIVLLLRSVTKQNNWLSGYTEIYYI